MVRFLLVLLAVLVAGLAVLFGRPWLYVVTGLILVGSLGFLGWWLWTTYQEGEPDRPHPRPDPEDVDESLEELGIVDIKPEGTSADSADQPPPRDEQLDPDPAESPSKSSSPSPSTSASGPALATQDPAAASDEPDASPTESPAPKRASTQSDSDSVFGALLESVRAALNAQTVCLLVQEDVALTYRIEALASTEEAVQRSGSFDTQTPLLTATMSRESVTYRSLAEDEVAVEDLGYYDTPPSVDHLALAPIAQPDASSTTFLLADAGGDADLRTSRARTLLTHFAETVALLLDAGRSPAERPDEADAPAQAVNGTTSESGSDTQTEDGPRPRSEIIAEEMEAAQDHEEPLALALVHLNRAESIARQGEEAVTSAERLFQARLEQKAPNQRVERFGELTYGVFFRAGPDTVEPWVAEFESAMAQEEGQLEGGVSVGVALWDDETPEALRTAATEALREAYETGTCTIVT